MKITTHGLRREKELPAEDYALGIRIDFGNGQSLHVRAVDSHVEIHSVDGACISVEPRAANMVYVREIPFQEAAQK